VVTDDVEGDTMSGTAVGVSKEHITKTPGVCGGKACIAGHRIRVMDVVVWHEHRGMSPEEIVTVFPSITLADVYAALAYYLDHREDVEAEFRHEEEMAEKYRPKVPSKLQQILQERNGG
jgi:uncharacterized protein (DUF433 family)